MHEVTFYSSTRPFTNLEHVNNTFILVPSVWEWSTQLAQNM